MSAKLSNLSLRQLRAVAEVAHRSSFVEAAAYLHLTPSALSESVKSLEVSLGLRLFDRTTRKVQPTAIGREFIELVRAALSQLDRAVEVVGELQNLHRGLVRCVGATSALACLVAPCLTELWRQTPQVQVEMRTSIAWDAVNALRLGEADFAIGTLPAEMIDDIVYQPLLYDCMGLVAAHGHPAVQGATADLRCIQQAPYVALTTLTMIDKLLAGEPDIADQFRNPSVRVDGTGSLAAILQQGVAVGILPALAIHQMGLRDLKFCPLVQPFSERMVGIFRLRGRSLTPAAQVVWDLTCTHSRRLAGVAGIRLVPLD